MPGSATPSLGDRECGQRYARCCPLVLLATEGVEQLRNLTP